MSSPYGETPTRSLGPGRTVDNGDKLSSQFTLPDGTTEQIDLTASSATPTGHSDNVVRISIGDAVSCACAVPLSPEGGMRASP